MARRRHTSEQIIHLLRQAEVALASGKTVEMACRELEISEQTYYRWRREYNTIRPHSARGYRPPAPEAVRPSPWFLSRTARSATNPRRITPATLP